MEFRRMCVTRALLPRMKYVSCVVKNVEDNRNHNQSAHKYALCGQLCSIINYRRQSGINLQSFRYGSGKIVRDFRLVTLVSKCFQLAKKIPFCDHSDA
jgi:hypothetical protein